MEQKFDVVVIGAGPGGYIAAIRLAQLGFQVACIDAWKTPDNKPAPGGTCTNVGCIPSKTLLQSSEHYTQAKHHFAEHGIHCKTVDLDLETMMARRAKIIKQNNDGILFLFKKNKVTFFCGQASFDSKEKEAYLIQVTEAQHSQKLFTKQVVIATGSKPRQLGNIVFDEEDILSNDGALRLKEVPKTMVVIGGGVIGLEMGSVWSRLGAKVTILEALPNFLSATDQTIAKEALKIFRKQGLNIHLDARLKSVKKESGGLNITYADSKEQTQELSAKKLIVSIGRQPYTEGLNLENIGLTCDTHGFIEVDADCKTNLPGIWAIGDVVRGPMLAHKAEEEGVAVAERIAGQHGHVEFNTIPWVIYTDPEIAWVGKTEQELKKQGVSYKAGQFPLMANARARASGRTNGFVKILADAKTDEVLGAHIMGSNAGELIAELVMAMEFKASSEDIARICHAHPTFSEAIKEAALAVDKRTLNL
jgi:dihydrolipoamide dehydrogenase